MAHVRARLVTAAGLLSAGWLAISASLDAQGTVVTRGPYLQRATPTSLVVRWRTAGPTDSVVRVGTRPDQLTTSVSQAAAATEHVVTLTGLTPHTRYYYSVGTSAAAIAGGDAAHTFVTAPVTGARTATRIWVLGDSGTADASARAVRDAYVAATGSRGTDLWLMLGDNAYASGTDTEYQAAVFAMYPDVLRQAALWPTFGNHDAIAADAATQSGPYFDVFTLPTQGEAGGEPSGTEAYYAFDYGNVHVVCLDSSESDRSPTGPMLSWLRRDLAATRAEWIIAFFHHAPYSKGSHDSDVETALAEMRQHAVPILEAAGVDLVLAGHSHSYERSVLLQGHVGVSSTLAPDHVLDGGRGDERVLGAYRKVGPLGGAGAVYITAGSSGQVTPAPLNHPVMTESRAALGSLVLDVDGPRLDVTFLGADGQAGDTFTLSKHLPATAPAAPRDLTATVAPGGGGVLTLDWRSGLGGGVPTEFVLDAGSQPGLSDFGTFPLASLRARFTAAIGPGRAFVRARARNASGTSGSSNDVEVRVDATGQGPPAAPVELQPDVSGDVVTLSWPAVPGAVAYRIEAGSAPDAADLGVLAVGSAAWAVAGVPSGVYFVRVRAIGSSGLVGPPTDDRQVTVGGAVPRPERPVALRASVAAARVTLVWMPPPGPLPVHYVLEAGASATSFGLARVVTPSAVPALAFDGVPPGTYFLRVRGENAAGPGLPSAVVRVQVP